MSVFFQYILPTLLGGTGLVAVLVNWKIEQLRERLKYRRELVRTWRETLLPNWEPGGDPITEIPAYASLRPHLKDDVRRNLESRRERTLPGIIEEIGRIERKWGLV